MLSFSLSVPSSFASSNFNKQAIPFAKRSKDVLSFQGNGLSVLDVNHHYEPYFNIHSSFDPDKAIMPWTLTGVFKKNIHGYIPEDHTYKQIPVGNKIYVGRDPFEQLDEIALKDSYMLGVQHRVQKGNLGRVQGYFELCPNGKNWFGKPRFSLFYTDGIPEGALTDIAEEKIRQKANEMSDNNNRSIFNSKTRHFVPWQNAALISRRKHVNELEAGLPCEIKKGDRLRLPNNTVFQF